MAGSLHGLGFAWDFSGLEKCAFGAGQRASIRRCECADHYFVGNACSETAVWEVYNEHDAEVLEGES